MADLNKIIAESLQMFNKWTAGYSEGQPTTHTGSDTLKSGDTNFSEDGQPTTHTNETTLKSGGSSDDWYDEGNPNLHSGKTVLQEGVLGPQAEKAYGETLPPDAKKVLGMDKKKRKLQEKAGVFVKKLVS